jgi:hypothetical protein
MQSLGGRVALYNAEQSKAGRLTVAARFTAKRPLCNMRVSACGALMMNDCRWKEEMHYPVAVIIAACMYPTLRLHAYHVQAQCR